jgi:hypothetical protein
VPSTLMAELAYYADHLKDETNVDLLNDTAHTRFLRRFRMRSRVQAVTGRSRASTKVYPDQRWAPEGSLIDEGAAPSDSEKMIRSASAHQLLLSMHLSHNRVELIQAFQPNPSLEPLVIAL